MSALAKGIAIGALGLALGGPPALSSAPKAPGGKAPTGSAATAVATATGSGPGTVLSATANCPRGSRAVGGGFEAPSSGQVAAVIFESARARQRGWRASAQLLDLGGSGGLTLTALAYCEPDAPKAKRRRSTAATGGQPQVGPTVGASCRRGEAALAGGFRMPPPLVSSAAKALVFDSHRTGDHAWATRVATGAAGPSRVTTEVYCVRGLDPGPERTATSPLNAESFELSTALASCAPAAERTGGFAQPLSGLGSFLFITESRRGDGGWRVTGLHSGTSPSVAVSALAYCG